MCSPSLSLTRPIVSNLMPVIMIKVAFVGAGFIAKFQVLAIAQLREVELTGVLKRGGAEELAALAGYIASGTLKSTIQYQRWQKM
jgi:predicted dehydrogenase